jgi:hypothetical protein
VKTLTLRISDAEHARLKARADLELLPVATLLRRLFQQYDQDAAPKASKPKLSKREQAFAEYHEYMETLPTDCRQWDQKLLDQCISQVHAWRVQGGNIPVDDMPVPEALKRWSEAQHGLLGIEEYDGMDEFDLEFLIAQYDEEGKRPPPLLMAAYGMRRAPVPLGGDDE